MTLDVHRLPASVPFAASNPSRSALRPMSNRLEHPADIELVSRALAGDEVAGEVLVERLHCVPRILAAFNQRMGGTFDATEMAELSQDVVASFWGRVKDYDGRASLETWAYGFCLRVFQGRMRRRQTRTFERLDEDGTVQPGEMTFADDYLPVHEALGRLDPREERIIRLKYFDDQTFEEIGSKLQVSPNTAKTCFYRGMRKLGQLLSGEGSQR